MARHHRVHLFVEDFRDLLVERVIVDGTGRFRTDRHWRHIARQRRANCHADRFADRLPRRGGLLHDSDDVSRYDELADSQTRDGENRFGQR